MISSIVTGLNISIHAPTRGATMESNETRLSLDISIHAPTRGATFCFRNVNSVIINFNPRSYKRSD